MLSRQAQMSLRQYTAKTSQKGYGQTNIEAFKKQSLAEQMNTKERADYARVSFDPKISTIFSTNFESLIFQNRPPPEFEFLNYTKLFTELFLPSLRLIKVPFLWMIWEPWWKMNSPKTGLQCRTSLARELNKIYQKFCDIIELRLIIVNFMVLVQSQTLVRSSYFWEKVRSSFRSF